jgi:4-hydroxy-2-oxoglutarate aldolase
VQNVVVLTRQEAAESRGSFAIVLAPSSYSSLVISRSAARPFPGSRRRLSNSAPDIHFPRAASEPDINSDRILPAVLTPQYRGRETRIGTMGILQTVVVGEDCIIAGLANLAPRARVKIMELYLPGNIAEAPELQAVIARGDRTAIKWGFVTVKCGLEMFYG